MNKLPICTPICFYCEKNRAVKEKYNKPCCDTCNTEFWSSKRPNENMSDEDKAKRHKALLKMFNEFF